MKWASIKSEILARSGEMEGESKLERFRRWWYGPDYRVPSEREATPKKANGTGCITCIVVMGFLFFTLLALYGLVRFVKWAWQD